MHSLAALEEFCLQTILKGQQENGEFKTFLLFPGKPENGWIYAGPSVFLTSSIAITLIRSKHEIAKKICERASVYVASQMERDGLWRFYPHNGLFKFNTPLDIDDTSLASYLLENTGKSFPNNKALLYQQINYNSSFYIWFLPRLRYLKTPTVFFRLVTDLRYSFPIFFPLKGRTDAALISYNDSEHAVNANVILYLGKNPKTEKAINHFVEDLLFGNKHNQYFYPSTLFTYYHASRVYAHLNISQLENLKNKVVNYFTTDFDYKQANVQYKAIALLTLLNFKISHPIQDALVNEIQNTAFEDIAKPYDYFCTKDRNMVGGSAEYTCAVVSEAIRMIKTD